MLENKKSVDLIKLSLRNKKLSLIIMDNTIKSSQ